MSTSFRPFEAADVIDVSRRLRPALLRIGVTADPASIAEGEALAAAGPAWTALDDALDPIACGGIATDRHGHGEAWAMIGALGVHHLAFTRFAARMIAESPCWRIHAMVAARAPEMRWARLIGLSLQAVLGPWGPERDEMLLFTRFRA